MPFPQSELEQAAEIFSRNGSYREVATEMGVTDASAWRRVKRASRLGMVGGGSPMPGFEIVKQTVVTNAEGETEREFVTQKPEPEKHWKLPEGMALTGNTAYLDGQGRIVGEWKIARADKEAALVQLMDYLKSSFAEVQTPHIPITPPLVYAEDKVNFIPCNDWHVNMLAWEREVDENWDLKLAEPAIGDAMCSAVARAGCAGVAIVLGGGDLLHNDNNLNRTMKTGNVLDCDTRHSKGREAAIRMMKRVIDEALVHNATVLVRFLKGNHDEYTTGAVAGYISAWYRNEPRVVVDLDENLFWCYQHGTTMLVATHGHTIRMNQLPEIMAGYWPKVWGDTKHHFGHFFHIHHRDKLMTEHGHCVVESHRAPVPKDGWHYGAGYMSGRDVQVITYHRERGETGRVIELVS